MDVYETAMQENDGNVTYNGSHHSQSSLLTVSPSNNRSLTACKSSKQWKRHHLQQRARQERLNNSRKWKSEGHAQALTVKAGQTGKPGNLDAFASRTHVNGASDIIGPDDGDKQLLSAEAESGNLLTSVENDKTRCRTGSSVENCSCAGLESIGEEGDNECSKHDASSTTIQNGVCKQDEGSSSEILKPVSKMKRHSNRDFDNSKPCKSWKTTGDSSNISQKYNSVSFCSNDDCLPDGFYDAGRDRPFMALGSFEQTLHLDSREVILVDRESDEELDAIALSAQALILCVKQLNGLARGGVGEPVDNLQIASLLALFVSDRFGGSGRSELIERARKSVSGSNYRKPFVCTCSTGNSNGISTSSEQISDTAEDTVLTDLCEKFLHSIMTRRNSVIVPIGSVQFGVCRHRAVLMKLVRGYLDFQPHALNAILVKKGNSWIRMVVDACRPHDIREETVPEYFNSYVPLSRSILPVSTENDPRPCSGSGSGPGSLPSLSSGDEVGKSVSSSLFQCKFGSVDAAAKVRTLEVCGRSPDEMKNFEYSCLGEVRILGAVRHSCIVKMYGHKISCKWVPSLDGNLDRRLLQSAIFMEYAKGGPLKSDLEKLSKIGEKCMPLELTLFIARDVAGALSELHSRHIIHRDIEGENIWIDLDGKKAGRKPIVKLYDFDRAVSLRSFLHTCCIAHLGLSPPDVCVGTLRWMAPEVLRAMYKCNRYGLGKLPKLTDGLEALGSCHEHVVGRSGSGFEEPELELETLSFLIDLFRHCTEENPADRPTVDDVCEMLLARTSNSISKRSYQCSVLLWVIVPPFPNFFSPRMFCY